MRRYDIDGDCVDDGGKEHSAIGTSFGRLHLFHLWWLSLCFIFLRVLTDHVLISKELNTAVSRVAYLHDFVPAEFCDRTQRLTSSYSDHRPIVVEFDLSILFEE